MTMIVTYLVYLGLSIALTVWVGQTLHRRGRVFLVDALGKQELADSVNHLLLVGFYLLNIGFVAIALRYGGQVHDTQGAIEYLSLKEGVVLLLLGMVHFVNLIVLSHWRTRAIRERPVDAILMEEAPRRTPEPDLGGLRTVAVPLDDNRPAPPRPW
jgi:hypothetical protein